MGRCVGAALPWHDRQAIATGRQIVRDCILGGPRAEAPVAGQGKTDIDFCHVEDITKDNFNVIYAYPGIG